MAPVRIQHGGGACTELLLAKIRYSRSGKPLWAALSGRWGAGRSARSGHGTPHGGSARYGRKRNSMPTGGRDFRRDALLRSSRESPVAVAESLLAQAQKDVERTEDEYTKGSRVSDAPESHAQNSHALFERYKQAQENAQAWQQAREWLLAQGPQGWGRVVPAAQRAERAMERAQAAYSTALEEPGPELVRLRQFLAAPPTPAAQAAPPPPPQVTQTAQSAETARAARISQAWTGQRLTTGRRRPERPSGGRGSSARSDPGTPGAPSRGRKM